MNMMNLSKTQKINLSIMVVIIYLMCLYFTQNFSFGVYQVRISTSLYALSYLFPFLVFPLGLANFLGNHLYGNLGYLDLIGGLIVGLLTCYCHMRLKKDGFSHWFMLLTIIFIPGLVVPIWLSHLISIPYKILVINLCTGQIFPALVGVLLIKTLKSIINSTSKEAI